MISNIKESMYKRILLKLSGEVMAGSLGRGIEEPAALYIANEVKAIKEAKKDIEIAVVIGAGNIFRGKENPHIERVKADYIGMMGTVINAMALSSALENIGVENIVMNVFSTGRYTQLYNALEGRKVLNSKKVLILAGGTASPYFTTDTTASLRACELECELLVKATKVDGLYTDDPVKNKEAKFIEKTTYLEVIEKNYNVMDITAVAMCNENNIPLLICNLTKKGNVAAFFKGGKIGSIVR